MPKPQAVTDLMDLSWRDLTALARAGTITWADVNDALHTRALGPDGRCFRRAVRLSEMHGAGAVTDGERLAAIHEGGHGCIGADLGYPPELLTIEGNAVAHSKHVARPEDAETIAALNTGAHFLELTPDALHFAVRQMVIDYAGPVAGRIAERRTGYQPIRLTPEPAREWEPRTMADGLPEPEIIDELLGKAPPVNDEPMAQARAFQNAGLTGAYLAEWAHAEAQVRVRARWGLIEQVADALLRHRTLDRAAFEAIYTAPGDADGAD